MAQDRAQILITAIDQTKAAFDSIRGNLGRLGSESNRIKGVLAGLGVSLTALGAATGFASMIKDAIDAADHLNKLSQKIGISVEALSTLRFAAEVSDVSLETLQTAIKGLSQNMNEANSGIGDGLPIFKALGIELKNVDGSAKSTEEVLLQIATVFSTMEDGATKSALAVKLFGRSGLEMIPFLNQGAAGIDQLTAEAQRLGLKLTTETAQAAEAFNDNLTALKASASSLGIALVKDFLPGLTHITVAMRDAANESGLLKALWVGLKGVVGATFGNTEAERARNEVERLQEAIASAKQKIASGGGIAAFFDDEAINKQRTALALWERDLVGAKKKLDNLTNPSRPPEIKSPTGKPSEDLQRIACVVSGGQWVNGKCEKKSSDGMGKDSAGVRLALVKSQAESEFKILKQGLDLQKAALDRSLDDRLVSIRDYHAGKTRIEQQDIDQELAARQKELTAQSKIATTSKDETTRLRALAEVKKLESEITVLNLKRGEVEVANAHAAAKAERKLALSLEEVRRKTRELTGQKTDSDRRAAIATSMQPLLEQLRAGKDAQGEADVLHLIDVESDLAALARLETAFQAAMSRMQVLQDGINIKRQSGLLTEAQARSQISALLQQTATGLDVLLPKMQALADSVGGEAVTRIAGLRNEVARLRVETDQYAVRFEGATRNALQGFFSDIALGSKDAFGNMAQSFKAAIVNMIAEALAARLIESLFGGFKGITTLFGFGATPIKKAAGGLVSGPGTGTSDSIPMWGSHGEYVVRAAAVKHYGVSLLDSLNNMHRAPTIRSGRVAFASGGLVQAPRFNSTGQAAAPANLTLQLHPDALHLSLRDWLDGELARIAMGGR